MPVPQLLGWGRSVGDDHSWMLFERVRHDESTELLAGALAALGRVLRLIHEIRPTGEARAVLGELTMPETMLRRTELRVAAVADRVG